MTRPFTLRLVQATSPADPRITYAFAAYAALHGFRVVARGPADLVVHHGDSPEPVGHGELRLRAAHRRDVPHSPLWDGGLPVFHPTPCGPDPLAEVAEWLTASHELRAPELDAVGRVPPRHGLAGAHGLDLQVPWVNRWLARLHREVRAVVPRLPPHPRSPWGGPVFVASHDLDHLSAVPLVNLRRVAENAAIAAWYRRDVRTAAQIVACALRRAAGRRPVADGVAELLTGEAERGVRSTYTVVPRSTHHRDPGYDLDDGYVRRTLRGIAAGGHELAVHGSYRSLETPTGLAQEYDLLAAAGYPASGGRQHWLRHRGAELFTALEEAGARWDSTLGYPDDLGYRHGAAFPFPPYDVVAERPLAVMEIPLVVMERSLCGTEAEPAAWGGHAVEVLRAAGKDGWGGTAVLWHDSAFTGTALPAKLADAYWEMLDAGDRWVTAAEVTDEAWARWSEAGVAAPSASAIPSA